MVIRSNRAPGALLRRRASRLSPQHRATTLAWVLSISLLTARGAIGNAWAADDLFAGATRLEPDHLVELVEARNANLEAVRATADEAATRIKSAGALDDPMLSYKLAPATIGSRELGTRQGVEVSQTLPWPGTLHARETKAKAEADAAQSDTNTRVLDLAAETKDAFAEWSFIHAALKINHQHQSHLQTLKTAMERDYAAGVGRAQDVLKTGLELARMENEALMLESQRRTIEARINALLNRAPDADLPEPASFKPPGRPPTLDQLEAISIARHPELKGLESSLAASDAGVSLARKAFYPDVTLQAGYDEMWDNKDQRPGVGVSINIPLQWGRREAELAGARAARRKAEWQLADRKAALLAKLAEAVASADQTSQSVVLYRDRLVPLADAAVSAALADYRRGIGDFSSVIEAERSKLDQELSLERALADQFRSFAALEQAAGGPLVDIEDRDHTPASDHNAVKQEQRP